MGGLGHKAKGIVARYSNKSRRNWHETAIRKLSGRDNGPAQNHETPEKTDETAIKELGGQPSGLLYLVDWNCIFCAGA